MEVELYSTATNLLSSGLVLRGAYNVGFRGHSNSGKNLNFQILRNAVLGILAELLHTVEVVKCIILSAPL